MTIAHVATNTLSGTDTTSGTVAIPAGAVTGTDLFLALCSKGSSATTAYLGVTDNDSGGSPNLWTLIGAVDQRKGQLYWKKATANSANKTITITGAITELSGGVSCLSGGAAGNPITSFAAELNASADETQAGFTPPDDDSAVFLVVVNNVLNHTVSTMACTSPGALTKLFDNANVNSSIALGWGLQVGNAAATGNFTWAQTNQATRSMVWAMSPLLTAGGGLVVKSRITSVLDAVHNASNW